MTMKDKPPSKSISYERVVSTEVPARLRKVGITQLADNLSPEDQVNFLPDFITLFRPQIEKRLFTSKKTEVQNPKSTEADDMFRHYSLEAIVEHEKALEFEWNPESGEIRGRDADRVIDLVVSAVKMGYVTGHPYPTSYDIKNPLFEPKEMAVILGQAWELPDDLVQAYPEFNDEDEDRDPPVPEIN